MRSNLEILCLFVSEHRDISLILVPVTQGRADNYNSILTKYSTETRASRGQTFRNMGYLVQLCLISQVWCDDGSGTLLYSYSW